MATTFSLDDMMKKINGLLAKADHPNTPDPEADLFRSKAEALMIKYRIEESTLIASGALIGEQSKPGSKVVPVAPSESPYLQRYWTLLVYIADHCGLRVKYRWDNVDGVFTLNATLVGYEADIRFAETLFTNVRVVFAERMEPKPKSDLSDEDNVYRMRSAGMERRRVADLMGYPSTSGPGKVTRLYKAACEARGEKPVLTGRSMSVAVFRDAYSNGFLTEFWNRLYKARNAADAGSGGEVVLANRKENVDEAFYSLFPEARPSDAPAVRSTKPAKARKITAAELNKWARMEGAAGQAGKAAGRKAASEVDVQGVKPTGRLHP